MEPPKSWDRTAWIAVGGAIGAVIGVLLTAYGIHVWKTSEALRVPRA